MNGIFVSVAFAAGLAVVAWAGVGFVGANGVALAMTAAIAGFYLLGAVELKRYRAATSALAAAVSGATQPIADLDAWLGRIPASLRAAVRLRIEGERVPLPGPALTPYLVGLLVMLGMLGTFLGMVVTFKGTVSALEGSADLQAIRSALAAPIRGLGLSFGTSVAGVAASAMLGLMSAVARRERADAARELDARIVSDLQHVSAVGQRREAIRALGEQSRALPRMVERLGELAAQIEQSEARASERLMERQQAFHREAGRALTGLAESVGSSLQASLEAGARAAGESLRPVVESAMAGVAAESSRLHGQAAENASAHLAAFASEFEARANALVASLESAASRAGAAREEADRLRLEAWTRELAAIADALRDDWRRVGDEVLERQQAAARTLEATATAIASRSAQETAGTLDAAGRLLAQSEALARARLESEAEWTRRHAEGIDGIAAALRAEMGALRAAEAERGEAAVARLETLQEALADHLATLGTALEAPMARLIESASEAPRAASEVIARLREQLSGIAERDNRALEERATLVARIDAVLSEIGRASADQRAAIESLATSSAAALQEAARRFSEGIDAQSACTAEAAARVAAGAVELASLGESFHAAVGVFDDANRTLVEHLQRVDEALARSIARSDEQLAYYVAQAREVIDLSLTSQKEIV